MDDSKDFLTKISSLSVNGLIQNPLYQEAILEKRKASFQKKIDMYNEKGFYLTQKEIDDLILSIACGKNTYKDLQDTVPDMNSPTLCTYLLDSPKVGRDQFAIYDMPSKFSHTYFQFKTVPENFFYLYEFKPTDTFILNVTGEDRLYELQKEQRLEAMAVRSEEIARKSLITSAKSADYAKKAYYAAVIIGILSLLLSVQSELKNLIQSIFY